MKKTVLASCLIALVFLNWKFHLYDRFFNPAEFYFVTKRGTEFFCEGEAFRFVGANTRLIHGYKERGMLAEALENANKTGLRVIRQWAVGECENDSVSTHKPIDKYYFQAGPNNWIEESFMHFDSLIAEASKSDIKVMITLFNNWTYYGGMPMYLKWTGLDQDSIQIKHEEFYTNPQIDKWVKAYIDKFVMRENRVTGILYRDDPTIFSWELVNEQRATADNYADQLDWTKRTAEYIKSIDTNHLVGTSMVMVDNMNERDQILSVFKLDAIDYVDLHAYPAEHWWKNFIMDEEHLRQLIDDYIQIAHFALQKPLVIGEFGFKRGETWLGKPRHELFNIVFNQAYKNGVSGIMPWSYSDPAWDDTYEINWLKEEHAEVCSLMANYADLFAQNQLSFSNENIGEQFGASFRIAQKENSFPPDTLYPATSDSAQIIYDIPIQSFSKAKWTSRGFWDGGEGYEFVYAKDTGYFIYNFYSPEEISISGLKLKTRLSADFPVVANHVPAIYKSDVTVSLNNLEIATIPVAAEKVYGPVYEVGLSKADHETLLTIPAGFSRLKIEVKEDAENQSGLHIFGKATSSQYKKDEIEIQLKLNQHQQPSG